MESKLIEVVQKNKKDSKTPCGHDPLSSFHANMPSRRQAQLRLLTTTGMVPIHVLKSESLRRRVGSTEYFGASGFCTIEQGDGRRSAAVALVTVGTCSQACTLGVEASAAKSTLRSLLVAPKTRLLVNPDTKPKNSHSNILILLGPQQPIKSSPSPPLAYRMPLRASFCSAVNEVGNLTLYLMMKLPLWPGFFEMGMPRLG